MTPATQRKEIEEHPVQCQCVACIEERADEAPEIADDFDDDEEDDDGDDEE